jgi:hypothetical protein
VPPRKARRPAADRSAHGPHGSLGERSEATTPSPFNTTHREAAHRRPALPSPSQKAANQQAEKESAAAVFARRLRANSIAIADVVVGERHRKDMGDTAGLAAIGLLNPITVDENGKLLASPVPTEPIIAHSEPRAVIT